MTFLRIVIALCVIGGNMIFSDLPSPAEASAKMTARAKASRRRETGIHFSGIMLSA
jgi:hypothetical protein